MLLTEHYCKQPGPWKGGSRIPNQVQNNYYNLQGLHGVMTLE